MCVFVFVCVCLLRYVFRAHYLYYLQLFAPDHVVFRARLVFFRARFKYCCFVAPSFSRPARAFSSPAKRARKWHNHELSGLQNDTILETIICKGNQIINSLIWWLISPSYALAGLSKFQLYPQNTLEVLNLMIHLLIIFPWIIAKLEKENERERERGRHNEKEKKSWNNAGAKANCIFFLLISNQIWMWIPSSNSNWISIKS